jgi:hypothetical protein
VAGGIFRWFRRAVIYMCDSLVHYRLKENQDDQHEKTIIFIPYRAPAHRIE